MAQEDKPLPEINHPELRKAVQAFPADFAANLDKASEDIRNLEAYLQSCGVCIPYRLVQPGEWELYWKKYGSKWRIVTRCGGLANDEERPLIESKASIRLMLWPYLAELVSRLAGEMGEARDGST